MPALALSLGLPFRSTVGGGAAGPPATPTGFTATAGNQLITLTWDSQPEADTFEIVYSTSNTFGTAVSLAAGITGTSFTHDSGESIQVGEKYYYWIQATNGAGTSGYAGSVTARSYVTLAHTVSLGLTTPTGTWTLGTLFFGTNPDPLPNGVSLSVDGNSYIFADGDWYDANTEELANDVAISGAFTLANNSGSSIAIWSGEP